MQNQCPVCEMGKLFQVMAPRPLIVEILRELKSETLRPGVLAKGGRQWEGMVGMSVCSYLLQTSLLLEGG